MTEKNYRNNLLFLVVWVLLPIFFRCLFLLYEAYALKKEIGWKAIGVLLALPQDFFIALQFLICLVLLKHIVKSMKICNCIMTFFFALFLCYFLVDTILFVNGHMRMHYYAISHMGDILQGIYKLGAVVSLVVLAMVIIPTIFIYWLFSRQIEKCYLELKPVLISGLLLLILAIATRYFPSEYPHLNNNLILDNQILLLKGFTQKKAPEMDKNLPQIIPHAGGSIEGKLYPNCLEVLERCHTKKYRYIEMDFSWTSDGHLVVFHDWDYSFVTWFGGKPGPRTLKEYSSLKMKYGKTQLALEDLRLWLEKHQDTYIITDLKQKNLEALQTIANKLGPLKKLIVPQIYQMEEYQPVKKMGFEKIIFTLYRCKASDQKIIEFAKSNPLLAITIHFIRAFSPLPQKLAKENIFVYAHTVNFLTDWKRLSANGVSGIYSDFLNTKDLR